jgi:hypothetical protein
MTLPNVYACTLDVSTMKRRRLLLGLGTVLSNTVSPTADFRVSVDSGTEVKAATANPTFDSRSESIDNSLSGGFPSPDGGFEDNVTFEPGVDLPESIGGRSVDFSYVLATDPRNGVGFGTSENVGNKIAANAKTNDAFEVAMNVDLPVEDTRLHAPTAIAIKNTGSASKSYAISYKYGEDVRSAGINQQDVAQIYEFVDVSPTDSTETVLSPASDNPTASGDPIEIGSDETFLIDIRVNLNFTGGQGTNIRTQIADEVGTAGGELQLLSNINVGTR